MNTMSKKHTRLFLQVPCQDNNLSLEQPVGLQCSCNSKTVDRITRPNKQEKQQLNQT